MTLAGFPHSGIAGSTLTCSSPTLFAAYRALLRLSVPRHPPCALLSLDRICSLAPVKREALRPTSSQHTRLVLSSRSTQIFSLPIPITRIFKQTCRGAMRRRAFQLIRLDRGCQRVTLTVLRTAFRRSVREVLSI